MQGRWAILDTRGAVAFHHHLTHSAPAQSLLVVVSFDRASPKKNQGRVESVDRAMGSEWSDLGDLARPQFRSRRRSILPYKQDKPIAGIRLVRFCVIAFPVVMAPSQMAPD